MGCKYNSVRERLAEERQGQKRFEGGGARSQIIRRVAGGRPKVCSDRQNRMGILEDGSFDSNHHISEAGLSKAGLPDGGLCERESARREGIDAPALAVGACEST